MANYNIDVKAKVNVSQLKSSIQESLNKTTIPVKPKFTPSVDDNNIKVFRNTVATYFQKEPIPIVFANPSQDNIAKILNQINKSFVITPTLKFDTNKSSEFAIQLNTIKQAIDEFGKNSKANVSFSVDTESYKQLFQTINNIKEEQKKISNLNISLGFSQEEKERLSNEITAIYALLKGLNNLGNSITVTEPNTDNLSSIKDKIQQYFQDNPIILTISQQINDVEIGSIAEKVKELLELQTNVQQQELEKQESIKETSNIQQEEIDKQIEKFKALEVEYDKHLIEKRELRNKEKQESEEHMQEMILVEKKLNEEQLQSNKQLLDEKALNYLEYANQLQEISKTTVEAIENNSKQSDFLSTYIQEIEQIVDAFRQGAINIEQVQDQISAKMSEAGQKGIIPQEVFDNTKKLLNNLEEEAGKSFDDWRKKQEKLYRDLQVLTEKQKKYDEKVWEDKAKSVQQMYDKQQISAEQYISRMNSLLPEAYEKGYDSAEKYSKAVDNVEKEQNKASQSADNLGNSVNNLGSRFDNAFNSLMRYFGVTKIFDAVQSSFSKMIQEVRDLDVELTEFSKVTDLTSQQTEDFINNAYVLGDAVARTGTEVVTATTLFKKMGYEINESMDFAKDALTWTNVADGMVSVEEAANMLISTMKAYGEETINTTQIIDALNEVSNKYATSSSALSNNLSTVAATLAASGTDLYQTIGLMTAGIEVMPDKASKVANGLKTISQRIRQLDGATADKLDEFLESKGVSRYDKVTGQLKGTFDILSEISNLWDTLTINEKQYIGEVMAGKNQITVLNALMTNFSTAVDATKTAMDSSGSSARELERVLNSIQGHIQRFQSAFEKLSKDLIDSDLFKDVVDFGTSVIRWIDDLVVNRGPSLLALLGGIGTTIASWKLANTTSQMMGFVSALGGIAPITAGAAIGIATLTAGVISFIQKIEKAKQQTQELIDAGSKGLPENKGLEETIKKYEELYQKQDFEGLSELRTILKQTGYDIDLLNDKYDEELDKLREELQLKQESYLTSKKIALEEGKSQSGDIIKSVVKANESAFGLDSGLLTTPGAYNKKLEEAINTIYQLDIGGKTLQAVIDDSTKTIDEKKKLLDNAYVDYQTRALWLQTQANEATDEATQAFYNGEAQQMLMWAGVLDGIRAGLDEQNELNEEVIDASAELVKTKLERMNVDIAEYSTEQIENLISIIDEINLDEIDIGEIPVDFEKLASIINDEDLGAGLRRVLQDELARRLGIEAAQASALLQELEDSEDGVSSGADQVSLSLSGAMATMDNYISSIELLNQAHMEFVDGGEISAETLRKIANAGLEAYLIIDEETRSLDVNRDAFIDDNKSIEDNAIASYVASQRAQLLADVKNIASNAAYDSKTAQLEEKTATEELTDALANESEEVAKNLALQIALNEAKKESANLTKTQRDDITSRVQDFVSQTQAGIAALRTLFNTASTSSGRTGTTHSVSHGSGTSSSTSSSSSSSASAASEREAKQVQQAWKDAFKVEYNKLKTYLDSEIITYEQYYAALEELNKHFFEGRAEFEEEYWKYQDEVIKGRKKYYEDELESYFKKGENILKHQLAVEYITEEEYYNQLTLLYETYYTDKEKYEEEYWKLEEEIYKLRKKQIKELEDELDDLYDQIEDLHKAYVESLEDDLDEIETTIGYAIDVIDEEIDRLKSEKQALDETNEALEEQIKLQELQDALEKAKQKKTRVYRKGQGFVYEQDIQAIGEAQTALDEYKNELQHKKRLSMVDEEINKLEQYKKQWKDVTERYKKAQDEMTAKGILGENARERVLGREWSAVGLVGLRYEETKDRIERANNATIEDLEAYIGDENTAKTLSYEIKRITDKLAEVKGKTITLQINTSNTYQSIQNIVDGINGIRRAAEGAFSTNNLDAWLTEWKKTILEAYNYIQQHTGGSSGSGSGQGSSGTGSNTPSGNLNNQVVFQDSNGNQVRVGDKVKVIGTTIPWYPADYEWTVYDEAQYDYGSEEDGTFVAKGMIRLANKNGEIITAVWPNSLQKVNGGSYGSNDNSNETEDPGMFVGEEDWSSGIPRAWNGEEWWPFNIVQEGDKTYWENPFTGEKYEKGNSSNNNYEPTPGTTFIDPTTGDEIYVHDNFASGTLGTKSKVFRVNENGIEAIVSPDGTVISAPTTGYGVIKNEYTKRLTDFASDPLAFLSKEFTGYQGNYQNNPTKNEVININGNLTLPNVTNGESFIDSIKTLALQYTTRR